ncbi:MAG: hypothetical protein IJ689_07695 [Alphaproteobacteria bacterium]|nr:hypothetical protein [Alphaproteobacteria bacterium]MBR1649459.1 hypothetical protein [Alphaproteobacteria bacterium]
MKNYILMLGVAGVVLGSYAAYAGNTATMQVTATIAHDVSLTVTRDIDLGTITINPAYTGNDTVWTYSNSGVIDDKSGGLVSASNATFGTFTANIPNPSVCNIPSDTCRLTVETDGSYIYDIFGGSNGDNACGFSIDYSGSTNTFNLRTYECFIDDVSSVTLGLHTTTITISYTPE